MARTRETQLREFRQRIESIERDTRILQENIKAAKRIAKELEKRNTAYLDVEEKHAIESFNLGNGLTKITLQ